MKTKKLYTAEPDYAVCPGEFIRETIKSIPMTQKEFALRMGISQKHLIEILKGKTRISETIAQNLERVTGTPAHIWMGLELQYRNDLSRLGHSPKMEEEADWLKTIPNDEIITRNQIIEVPDKNEQIEAVLL